MKTSQTMAIALLLVGSGFAIYGARAQMPGVTRIDLQRHNLAIPGREVIQAVVEIDPGVTAPGHTHPGDEIIYVLEGTLVYDIEGQGSKTVKAGDVLFVPAGVVHSAKNIGSVKGAELATYVVEIGKPLLVPAQ